jgi:xylulokinase
MCELLELARGVAAAALEGAEVSGRPRTACPWRAGRGPGGGRARRRVDGPGPASVVLGTSGVVFAGLERYAADPQARVHASATRCRARGTRWA